MKYISNARRVFALAMLVLGFLHVGGARASISLNATRVVLSEKQQEATLIVRNGGSPVLIQSWLETNSDGDSDDLPFAITPPLARMPPHGQQLLRVLHAGGASTLPGDRESVMWLNVQEVPQASSGVNQLQFAVRQRIKVFFRPAGLPGDAASAPSEVRWTASRAGGKTHLRLTNPTAYHVNFSELRGADGRLFASPGMLAPGQSSDVSLDDVALDALLSFKVVNDYGGADAYRVQLSGQNDALGSATDVSR